MMAVKMPISLGSITRSRATAGIMTLSDRTESEIITWMASMLATGTIARFTFSAQPHPEEREARLEGWERALCLLPILRDAALRAAPQDEALSLVGSDARSALTSRRGRPCSGWCCAGCGSRRRRP